MVTSSLCGLKVSWNTLVAKVKTIWFSYCVLAHNINFVFLQIFQLMTAQIKGQEISKAISLETPLLKEQRKVFEGFLS